MRNFLAFVLLAPMPSNVEFALSTRPSVVPANSSVLQGRDAIEGMAHKRFVGVDVALQQGGYATRTTLLALPAATKKVLVEVMFHIRARLLLFHDTVDILYGLNRTTGRRLC